MWPSDETSSCSTKGPRSCARLIERVQCLVVAPLPVGHIFQRIFSRRWRRQRNAIAWVLHLPLACPIIEPEQFILQAELER